MKTLPSKFHLLIVVCTLFASIAFAQDSAVFNASKGTWRLYYKSSETKQWVKTEYVQQNAIAPSVQSSVRWNGSAFQYDYRVSNKHQAKQAIDLFRVWGIPLIYEVPNLPPITVDPVAAYKLWTDQMESQRASWPTAEYELWTQQMRAQNRIKDKFEKTVVIAPKGWRGGLRTDEEVNQTSFVWTPGWKDTDPDGIEPGRSQNGFRAIRTELPGVTTAKMTGSTEEPWGLDGLPETPFWEQKTAEIRALDYLTVPVLGPIIVIPSPYNGAELARRVKAHVATWIKLGLITQDTLDRLNRSFDALINAQTYNNIAGTQAAVKEILQEAYSQHRGLDHTKNEEDDDEHDAEPVKRKAPATVPLNRVAARALSFDLTYLLTRAHIGK